MPITRKSGYLPSLDGWRAIAIVAVLMAHDQPWSIAGHSDIGWRDFGGSGVYLFFSISGILICWRILEDEEMLGVFKLRDFYIRRLCRIQPAALVYLAVIGFLMLLASCMNDGDCGGARYCSTETSSTSQILK